MRLTTSPTNKEARSAGKASVLKRVDTAPKERSGRLDLPTPMRRVKNLGKRGLRRLFEVGQRLGFDFLPRHFYSQVPDIRQLRANDSWKRPRSMVGVQGIDLSPHFDFVESCCSAQTVGRLRRDDLTHKPAR